MLEGDATLIPTVDDVHQDIAEDFSTYLVERETAAIRSDIAGIEGQFQSLTARQAVTAKALTDYLAISLGQRSDIRGRLENYWPEQREMMKPIIAAHDILLSKMLQWGMNYLDTEAKGNANDTTTARTILSQQLRPYNEYNYGYRYEYPLAQSFRDKYLCIPRNESDLIETARKIRTQENALRATALSAETAAAGIRTQYATLNTNLTNGTFSLTRQSASVDGNTPEERAMIDALLEHSLSDTLQLPFTLGETRLREGPRVDLADAALHATMTDVEFQALALSVAGAVQTSNGIPLNVTAAIRTALATDAALTDILERSVTATERHSQSPLAADMLSGIEAVSEIPYARMFVEAKEQGYEGTLFTIRIRNPGSQTYVRTNTWDSSGFHNGELRTVLTHPDGLADGSVDLSMQRQFNGDIQRVDFCIYTDETMTTMLDRVVANFDKHKNIATFLTEQPAWDHVEDGRLEREPITPRLTVYQVTGPNVLVAIQSPHDQSIVTFERNGLLDTQRTTHEDGTPYHMSTVTFNVSLPSGTYPLRLYDRPNGLLLDEVLFQWNQATKSLAPVGPAESAKLRIPEGDNEAAAALATFQTLSSVETVFNGDPQFNRGIQSTMITKTAGFPQPFNLNYDPFAAFYALRPDLREDTVEATIDAKWKQMGLTRWTRKQIANMVYTERSGLLQRLREMSGHYDTALGMMLGDALNGLQKIRQGTDPATVFNNLTATWTSWVNPQRLNMYNYRSFYTDEFTTLTNLRLPSPETVIGSAKILIDQVWDEVLRLQANYRQYQEGLQTLLNDGYRLTAGGEIVRASEYVRPTNVVDAHLVRLQARYARITETSDDPRMVAYRDALNQTILVQATGIESVLTVAQIDGMIDSVEGVRMALEAGGMDPTDPKFVQEALSFIDIRKAVNAQDIGTLMYMAEGWYQRGDIMTQYPVFGEESVRDDTAAGRIFNGLMQQSAVKQGNDLKLLFVTAERILGIRAIRLHNLCLRHDRDAFYAELKQQFETIGQEELFIRRTLLTTNDTNILSVATDKNAYTDLDSSMRVAFDIAGTDTSFSQWNVYLADANGDVLLDTPALLEQNAIGSLSATIPMYRIQQALRQSSASNTYTIRLAVWKNPTDTAGIPGDFISDAFTLTFNRTIAPPDTSATTLHNLSEDLVENAVLNEVAKNFPLPDITKHYWLLGSGFHDGNEYNAVDLNHIDGGDSDRGNTVTAVADGVLHIGSYTGDQNWDLRIGAVTIDHSTSVNGTENAWQSGYLHMPIFATGQIEPVPVKINGNIEQQEREIFEARRQIIENGALKETGEVIRLWNDKEISAVDAIGYVGGRDGVIDNGSYNERVGNAHLHFFGKKDGKAIDLRPVLLTDNLATSIAYVKAFDAGPDGSWSAYEDNRTLPVTWDAAEKSYVSTEHQVLLDRRDQEPLTPGVQTSQHWIAWHADPTQRHRVIWKAVQYENESEAIARWVKADDLASEWDGINWIPHSVLQ